MDWDRRDFSRKPDLPQRAIHGLFGGFLGALLGVGLGSFFDGYFVIFAGLGALVCFLIAFARGDTAIEWIVKAGWWG